MKKNILILLGDYYPTPSQNGFCVSNLVKNLKDKYDITIISSNNDNGKRIRLIEGVEVYFINTLQYFLFNKFKNPLAQSICKFIRLIQNNIFIRGADHFLYKKYYREFKKIFKKKKINYIMSVCYPFYTLPLANKIKKIYNIPYITYIMDEYSEAKNIRKFVFLRKYFKKLDYELEKECLNNANMNLVTDGFFNSKISKEIDIQLLNKVKFPLINRNIKRKKVNIPKNKIDCIISSSFIRGVREPNNLYKLIDEAPKKFRFIICSRGDFQNDLENYCKNRQNVEFYGSVSKKVAEDLIYESDVLIIIDNLNNTQISSKKFEYINTGKVIVSLYNFEDQIKCFDDYENAICKDASNLTNEDIYDIYEYCEKHYKNVIGIDDIYKNYYEYTVEYNHNLIDKLFDNLI